MAKKRKKATVKKKKRKSGSVAGAGQAAIAVGKAVFEWSNRIATLRKELKALKRRAKSTRKKRR